MSQPVLINDLSQIISVYKISHNYTTCKILYDTVERRCTGEKMCFILAYMDE